MGGPINYDDDDDIDVDDDDDDDDNNGDAFSRKHFLCSVIILEAPLE